MRYPALFTPAIRTRLANALFLVLFDSFHYCREEETQRISDVLVFLFGAARTAEGGLVQLTADLLVVLARQRDVYNNLGAVYA
jgi:hypothetical protein